ncbi:AtpZ/AtpI family protein [Sinomonas mesophila]|uniref:AtpZ/AtpI family protein n=1 Tax=Sinomonas mesophila TaxID=1531955 RepID=UPI00098428C2|nr:AtpZ/AtpI family protein [Sinomonas mesophila]
MADPDPRASGRENEPENGPENGPDGDGGYNAGMAVFSYVIGGIVVWSLIGWGLDNLLKTRWLVLAGALVGIAGGIYLTIKHGLFSQRRTDPHGSTDGRDARGEDRD